MANKRGWPSQRACSGPMRGSPQSGGWPLPETQTPPIRTDLPPKKWTGLSCFYLHLDRTEISDGRVATRSIVQRGLRKPAGPFVARFFIGIILGLVAEFAFMVPSTRVVLSSSAARWKSRKRIGGLKCRPGCSTGRHALTPGFWQLNRTSASRHLRRSLRCSIWL